MSKEASWDAVLRTVGGELGLQVTPGDGSFGSARGQIGGLDVELSSDEDRGEQTVAKLTVETGTEHGMWFRRRGTQLHQGDAEGTPFASGDPPLDQLVELAGVPPPLQQALRTDATLRAWVAHVAGQVGATLASGELTWMGPFPNSAQELRARLDPMLDLARRLHDPFASAALPPTATPLSAWLRLAREASEHQQQQRLLEFFQHITPRLGQGQAFANPSDREVEWRGSVDGFPLRIKIDTFWSVEMALRANNQSGWIDLEYAPDKVPLVGAPPPWDDNDVVRIFFGRGVFIEGSRGQVEGSAEQFGRLPPEAQSTIVECMRGDRVRYLRLRSDIEVHFYPELHEMLDPEQQIARVAHTCAWLARGLGLLPPAAAQGYQYASASAAHPLTCRYCSTLFFLGGARTCPNCGAPPQA
jgi:hypothetical protein